jgi:hypothetical protein
MGPKKGKGKKVEEEKPEPTEYDSMDLEMLREVVPMLRQQLEKSMLDRNYVQLERVRGWTMFLGSRLAPFYVCRVFHLSSPPVPF